MQMIYCEDILYVPIHNYKNKSCYIIASVHLLHSSKTLNHLLLKNNDLPFNDLLTMLKTYACVCYENFYNVEDILNRLLEQFVDKNILATSYSHIDFLCYYFIPLLYSVFPEHMKEIIMEIDFKEFFIDKYKYVYTKKIQNLLKLDAVSDAVKRYMEYVENIPYDAYSFSYYRKFEIKVIDGHSVFHINTLNIDVE